MSKQGRLPITLVWRAVEERRQLVIEAPRVTALPELVHDRAGDGETIRLGEGAGAAIGLHAPERIGQRVHKLFGAGFQKGPPFGSKGASHHGKGPVTRPSKRTYCELKTNKVHCVPSADSGGAETPLGLALSVRRIPAIRSAT